MTLNINFLRTPSLEDMFDGAIRSLVVKISSFFLLKFMSLLKKKELE
jgi:hypothetical protein